MWKFLVILPALYLAGNAYIYWQGVVATRGLPPAVRVTLAVLFWLGALSFFGSFFLGRFVELPEELARVFSRVGSGWLVFTLYMTLILLAFWLLKVVGVGFEYPFLWSLLLTVGLLGYGYYHYLHPIRQTIEVQVDKPLPGDKPVRIVAVSDIHLGYATDKEMLRHYVELINAEHPDLVLIGGDLVDNNVKPLIDQRMEEELCRIQAPMGIYMVPGNHEYISGMEACARFIERTPIVLLRDSVVTLPDGIRIAGRDDRSNHRRLPVERLLESVDKRYPIILLDHQPYDLDRAARAGADLQFSGHTHRGQVWPMSWVVDHLFELSHGLKRIGESTFYVSSGLSLWGPPFRIGTDSELVIFELRGNSSVKAKAGGR